MVPDVHREPTSKYIHLDCGDAPGAIRMLGAFSDHLADHAQRSKRAISDRVRLLRKDPSLLLNARDHPVQIDSNAPLEVPRNREFFVDEDLQATARPQQRLPYPERAQQ